MAKSEQPAPQWTRMSPDERREEILEVAARHFAQRPYDAVSTIEIAAEAGVNRGLIHHYIGTKRDLYLEVLRRTLRIPQFPPFVASGDGDLAVVLDRETGLWLDDVERNRETWLAAHRLGGGFGLDPDVDAILREARERAIDEALKVIFDPADAPPAVRGLLSAIGSLATQALVEWLELGRLTRGQVHVLLVSQTLAVWQNLDALLSAERGTRD